MAFTASKVPMMVMSSTITTTVASIRLSACSPATIEAVLHVNSFDELNLEDGLRSVLASGQKTRCAPLLVLAKNGANRSFRVSSEHSTSEHNTSLMSLGNRSKSF